MNNQMSIGSFLNFGIENTKRHFLKFLLNMVSLVVFGIVLAIFAVFSKTLNDMGIIIGSLLIILLSIVISFGFYKNILNICRGDKVDIMAFIHIKPATMLNFSILMILMIIALTIGYTLFIIPGIILTVMLLPAPFFIIDRDMGPIAAISESIKITAGHKMDIFAGFFISIAVAYLLSLFIITLIFTIPMSMFIYVYPYLQLTGQLDEAKKNLEANVAGKTFSG